jgi:hypothetical protein
MKANSRAGLDNTIRRSLALHQPPVMAAWNRFEKKESKRQPDF